MKDTKKKSWQNYVNRLSSSTRTYTIWRMNREISGKNQSTDFKHLTKNNSEATTKKDITDTLAETFSANSSLNDSNPQFLTFKTNAEKHKLNFMSNNTEDYSKPFTSAELKEAI